MFAELADGDPRGRDRVDADVGTDSLQSCRLRDREPLEHRRGGDRQPGVELRQPTVKIVRGEPCFERGDEGFDVAAVGIERRCIRGGPSGDLAGDIRQPLPRRLHESGREPAGLGLPRRQRGHERRERVGGRQPGPRGLEAREKLGRQPASARGLTCEHEGELPQPHPRRFAQRGIFAGAAHDRAANHRGLIGEPRQAGCHPQGDGRRIVGGGGQRGKGFAGGESLEGRRVSEQASLVDVGVVGLQVDPQSVDVAAALLLGPQICDERVQPDLLNRRIDGEPRGLRLEHTHERRTGLNGRVEHGPLVGGPHDGSEGLGLLGRHHRRLSLWSGGQRPRDEAGEFLELRGRRHDLIAVCLRWKAT